MAMALSTIQEYEELESALLSGMGLAARSDSCIAPRVGSKPFRSPQASLRAWGFNEPRGSEVVLHRHLEPMREPLVAVLILALTIEVLDADAHSGEWEPDQVDRRVLARMIGVVGKGFGQDGEDLAVAEVGRPFLRPPVLIAQEPTHGVQGPESLDGVEYGIQSEPVRVLEVAIDAAADGVLPQDAAALQRGR